MDQKQHQFYPKVHDQSDVHFTEDEIQLLCKGPKYNLHYKPKHWLKTLALEAATAISLADESKQNYLRHAVSKSLSQLINKIIHNSITGKREWKNMKGIKQKIMDNRLIITQADKGKTIVIIHEHEYNKLVHDFININNFSKEAHDPTKQCQNSIAQTIR
jgi:mRNA-degrading endonuclease RelE of RelBE toxin-antitoxin system